MLHEGQKISGSLVMMINTTNDKVIFTHRCWLRKVQNSLLRQQKLMENNFITPCTCIPYHTPQKFMDYLSQQFYTADERINFDHINFYRLLCQTIKSIEKRFQVLTHYWFQMNNDGTVHEFFFATLSEYNNISYNWTKKTRFSCND